MSSLTPDPMAPATEQKTHKSLTMKKVDGKPGQVYYPYVAIFLIISTFCCQFLYITNLPNS